MVEYPTPESLRILPPGVNPGAVMAHRPAFVDPAQTADRRARLEALRAQEDADAAAEAARDTKAGGPKKRRSAASRLREGEALYEEIGETMAAYLGASKSELYEDNGAIFAQAEGIKAFSEAKRIVLEAKSSQTASTPEEI